MTDGTVSPLRDSRYCGGKKRQGEGTCTRPAGWGTEHVGAGSCKLHGGNTPSGAKAGELALVDKQARELFGKLAPERAPVDNPLAAYAELAARVLSWMDLMDELLGDLRSVGYEHERAGEQVRATVQVFERAMDRANAVLASYARLRIDERLAEITEKQKRTVIRAIEAGLDEAGVSDEKRQDARRRVARHLRVVA
jgi:hypothetical protein